MNSIQLNMTPLGIRAIASSTLTPIYKQCLISLTQKTQFMSIENVKEQSVSSIYKCVIEQAKISTKPEFSVDIEEVKQDTNKVVCDLERLFPDSKVTFNDNKINIKWSMY